MDESIRVIRVHIDGAWSADQLGRMLLCLSDLYNLRLVMQFLYEEQIELERYYFEPPDVLFRRRYRRYSRGRFAVSPVLPILDDIRIERLAEILETDELLEVRRISYASPGIADLAGFGTIVGHIKDFTLAVIERGDSKRRRKLADDEKEAEIQAKRIENARNLVALAKEMGCSQTDFRRLVAFVDDKQEILVQLANEKKLVGVSEEDGGSEP